MKTLVSHARIRLAIACLFMAACLVATFGAPATVDAQSSCVRCVPDFFTGEFFCQNSQFGRTDCTEMNGECVLFGDTCSP